ncbi:MAG: DnaJ C-terminal domain-containing protein [Ramlibacter sp.]
MKYKDYYAALGVPRDADAEAIKKAYRKLARQHHPDVSKDAGAEARFKEVAEAYATLKDPEKRAAYDQLGQRRPGEDLRPPPQWEQAFGGADAFADMDLADLLAALRRGGSPGRGQPQPRRGHDHEASVRLSLEEAHRGTTMHLDVAHEDGTRTLAVTIPPGVTDGQRLRLRGKGAAGRHGGPAGDIYLHIQLAPHALFRVDGHDLYFDLALAPWEAALGAEVEVPTLDGPVLLTVPAGTRSGRKLRLRGRGLANGHGGRGDLYALAHVDVPATLTARERELFEELARTSGFDARRAVAHTEGSHAGRK